MGNSILKCINADIMISKEERSNKAQYFGEVHIPEISFLRGMSTCIYNNYLWLIGV